MGEGRAGGEGSWERGELGEDRQRRERTDRGGSEEGQVRSSDGMPRKTVSRHMGHL